jgi:hypothetical protein
MTPFKIEAGFAPSDGATPPVRASVPPAAKWLGAFGAIPFVTLALAAVFLEDPDRETAWFALAAYGAVILSFLGGIHWGLAVADGDRVIGEGATFARLGGSVVPSLVSWAALFLPAQMGMMVLAAAFSGMLLFDCRASRMAQTPPWYPTLRWPLTITVVMSLAVAAVA